jgi:branched-chain amino acid transport system substrate-binding protein
MPTQSGTLPSRALRRTAAALTGVLCVTALFGAPTASGIPARVQLTTLVATSGPLAAAGAQQLAALEAVYAAANAGGGVHGAKLVLTTQDPGTDPAALRQLLGADAARGVRLVSGTTDAAALPAAVSGAGAPALAVLSDGGSDAEFTTPSIFPLTVPTSMWLGAAVSYSARSLGYTDVAYLYDGGFTSAELDQADAILGRAGKDVYRATLPASVPDCTASVLAAMAQRADTLAILGGDPTVTACVRAAHEQGFAGRLVVPMSAVDDASLLTGLRGVTTDILAATPFATTSSPQWQQTCGADLRRARVRRATFGFATTLGCVGATVVLSTLDALGASASPPQIAAYLRTHSISTGGLSATVRYGRSHMGSLSQLAFATVNIATIRGGRWVVARTGYPLRTP